jgi:oxygen-independent coproporphyrinogen-3 oxidase
VDGRKHDDFDTIYFGGGTPSLLKPKQIGLIIESLRNKYAINPDCEITLEANPETVNGDYFEKIKGIGVNRISIGIQSFDDAELKTLGRIHAAQTGLDAIKAARESGFDCLSIDLIFGIPGQDIDSWRKNLAIAINQNPAHISAYGLTVERDTPLEALIQSGKLDTVDEQVQLEMYEILVKTMTRNGYGRYEISNFAKTGKESRHNLKYWRDNFYMGFGPSAHSYDGETRKANVRNLAQYCEMLNSNREPIGFREQLSSEQKTMERLMMGIRLAEGVILADVISAIDKANMKSLADDGLVDIDAGKLIITEKGLPVTDKIIAKLIKL